MPRDFLGAAPSEVSKLIQTAELDADRDGPRCVLAIDRHAASLAKFIPGTNLPAHRASQKRASAKARAKK